MMALKNSVHISLNFDPSEKLDEATLKNIADTYMNKIGFGDQPYLVYQHFDAGHPHIHIVTTNIQRDGSRIKSHNIGRNQSEKARKEIELSYGLVRAESHQQKEAYQLKPINALKVQYGRSETKRAITNVLDRVLSNYKYTSLPELNAVLKQYNGHEELKQQELYQLKQIEKKSEWRQVPPSVSAQSFNQKESNNELKPTLSFSPVTEGENIVQELMQPEFTQAQLPYELKK